MEKQTTGQRIASRRKLANLSQEAISQQLCVSRQAVSKWESDTALPDIDNLIALSKIFGVSVGWLLGTESDPSFDPSTGLSDAQLKMVKQIVCTQSPRQHRSWILLPLALCILALSVFGIVFQHQITSLSDDNAAAQSQITDLKADNEALLSQMESMSTILSQQVQEDRLLLNCIAKAYLSDDMQTISITFYLQPKLFQDNAQAYLTILNSSNDPVTQTLKCEPIGQWYYCHVQLPAADGYHYAFLLASNSGYQEQSLDKDFMACFQDLYSACRYHIDPTAEKRTVWDVCDTEYTFTQPICSPLIDFANGYVGYEAIDVTLYHNGQPIWTQSLREAFREHAGAYMRTEEPLIPDIRAPLPQLTPGDTLTLEISAKNYNGQTLHDVLEHFTVTSEQ